MRAGLAGIEYVGVAGITQPCLDALMRLLQSRAGVKTVQILTSSRHHCLLLTTQIGDLVAVKSGFGSGYRGEGPRGFSRALCLLDEHGADFEEYDVDNEFIDRVDMSALTLRDLRKLHTGKPILPSRWSDYIDERDWELKEKGRLWNAWSDPTMPYPIIDRRILDLAKTFWEDPDNRLLTGYRRLEDLVRERTGLQEHGAKLFSAAFHGNDPKLEWSGCDSSEQQGRGNLFVGTTMVYRNPRAHKELEPNESEALVEFLLLNHLFLMESRAIVAKMKPAAIP